MNRKELEGLDREDLIKLALLQAPKEQRHFNSSLLLAAFAVLLLTPIALYSLGNFLGLDQPNSWNELGDSYGVANAICSALAFYAIYHTLKLQREDVDTQQAMLLQSISEMKETSKATKELAKAQVKANSLQSSANSIELRNQYHDFRRVLCFNRSMPNATLNIRKTCSYIS